MEASALHAPVGLARQRSTIGLAVLRLRSDEQLVALLRAGHEEAFQVIHDRYHARLFAYMRQMLSLRQDVEDALQEVFERAYSSLLAGDRELALRPWLYRIAHNRCVDHLRRPVPPPPEAMLQLGTPSADPIIVVDRREALRRLMDDVRRLPDQQRSALLMRELGGISYAEVAQVLGVTVPAVKSLLVRARISLAQAVEARDTACAEIQAELVLAHEGRVRPNAMARRHMRDCAGCREFRGQMRGVRRRLLALGPSAGVCGLMARLLGGGGSGGVAGGGAAMAVGGSAAGLAGGATAIGGGGILVSAGALATSAGHVATLIAATVVTAGGAAALQHSIAPVLDPHHAHKAAHVRAATRTTTASSAPAAAATALAGTNSLTAPTQAAAASTAHSASATGGHRVHRIVAGSAADGLLPTPDPTRPARTVSTAVGGTSVDGLAGGAKPVVGAATSGAGTGMSTATGTGGSGAGSSTTTGSGSSTGATGAGSGSGSASSGSGSTGTGTASGTGTGSAASAGTGSGSGTSGSTGSGQGAGVGGTSGSSGSSSPSYPYTT